ncbi:AAA family ATPase [Segetibacter koreensis]|uniref:AAA family ATPase n=1 Tax=Segetibacter koreensis TaxID=398037 RepID=UPI0003A25AF1|nr:AAA family ATPase [Segetibacter koreensis]
MELLKASRKRVKIKMALQGPSGSGKTYSALLLAYGLCNNWNKIVVIDTENRSSELYSHLGDFFVMTITPPFTPERYIQALDLCEKEGMEVIIIDSISHEWENILDQHSQMIGNSYTNWNKLTPRHNSFVQRILQSPAHIVGTIRAKQEYVLSEKNGKQVPEKVGMKGVTREGMDYEFTLVFEIDITNSTTATKDRTSLFKGKPSFIITPETGQTILNWCNTGKEELQSAPKELPARINECKSMDELLKLYYASPANDENTKSIFSKKRIELEKQLIPKSLINNQNQNSNGTISNTTGTK